VCCVIPPPPPKKLVQEPPSGLAPESAHGDRAAVGTLSRARIRRRWLGLQPGGSGTEAKASLTSNRSMSSDRTLPDSEARACVAEGALQHDYGADRSIMGHVMERAIDWKPSDLQAALVGPIISPVRAARRRSGWSLGRRWLPFLPDQRDACLMPSSGWFAFERG